MIHPALEVSTPRRVMIVTDAWEPQINGVVRCYQNVLRELRHLGHDVEVVHPGLFRTVSNPLYGDVRLALPGPGQVGERIRNYRPGFLHVATEGPLGVAARRLALRDRILFTTTFHTHWPAYMKQLARVPEQWTWRFVRWFHGPSACVMAPTDSAISMLREKGIARLAKFARGVDLERYWPRGKRTARQKPILTYVGRVSTEKGIEDFLNLRVESIKRVVGDGPARPSLQKKYKDAEFLGFLTGDRLAQAYSDSDVLVFPSRTDTFGQVILEAMACGTPVAAYPVTGPIDLVQGDGVGALHEDLGLAVQGALATGNSEQCVAHARTYRWSAVSMDFLRNLAATKWDNSAQECG